MELRAWCLEDQRGVGADLGRGRAAVDATCAPPMRWLMTTTPDPKSWLHAHRVMSLCVLPPPPPRPATVVANAPTETQDTIVVAGDSGGGVALFTLQDVNGNLGSDTARETRSQPAGRWMAPGKRPVLCLAHVRVTQIPVGLPSPQSPVHSEQTKTKAAVERGGADRGPTGNFAGQGSTSDNIGGVEAVANRYHRRGGAESVGSEGGEPQVCPERLEAYPKRSQDCPERSQAQENVFVPDKRRCDPPFAEALQDRGEVDGAGKETAAEVADFIATGDTGGTVTLWEFMPGGGCVAPSEGEGPSRSSKLGE
ncbi:unnamed protein product, partial [Laminaria digitata]